jgi:hypothetical protein
LGLYGFNEVVNTDDNAEVAVSYGELILTYQATIVLYDQLKSLVERWEFVGKKVEVSEKRREVLAGLLNDF